MNDLPDPLTPADCDLRDFTFMPLQVQRLRDSEFAANVDPEAGFYAFFLWAAAWHQVPAGSLPDDEATLTRIAGLGRDRETFRRLRDGMLYGFVKCSDGRLYHRTVCEQALASWEEKQSYRRRREVRAEAAKTAARVRWQGAAQCEPDADAMRDASGGMRNACDADANRMPNAMPKGTGTGTGTGIPSAVANAPASAGAAQCEPDADGSGSVDPGAHRTRPRRRTAEPPPDAGPPPPDMVAGLPYATFALHVAKAAGMVQPPGDVGRFLPRWLADGLEPEADILSVAQGVHADVRRGRIDPPRTFAFLDARMRSRLEARRIAAAADDAKYREILARNGPPNPRPPLRAVAPPEAA